MRFTRIVPTKPDELRDAVFEDLEALEPGLRVVASGIPVDGRGMIPLLAHDRRGRLALLSLSITTDSDSLARAIDQWDWAVANLGLLRALAPDIGADLSLEPRVILVTSQAPEELRRLAGYISRPEIEIFGATLIASGDGRGVLVDRLPAISRPAAGRVVGADPVLAALPAGHARSVMRRILEELGAFSGASGGLETAGIDGGIDLRREGRAIASLLATAAGVEMRRFDGGQARRISSDDECREAAQILLSHARSAAVRDGGPAGAQAQVHHDGRPGEERKGAAEGSFAPVAAALTSEEIAEFERLDSRVEHRMPRSSPDSPAAGLARSGFVEN